ncbi:MAG: OadG family protein [Bacteroidales bacterium]|nr:OadG family protein [Bacteroidales bacterium]
MENLSLGFQLMGIGMVTVFIILLIVIYGSGLLIKLINKIAPEEAPKAAKANQNAAPMAVLEAAVAQITGGKGHIVNVTKVN